MEVCHYGDCQRFSHHVEKPFERLLHAAMGATFGAQCSKVDSDPAGLFSLWERAQAIVLLSRTKLGRDMFFVGSPEETAKAIVTVLRQTSQYFEYMRHILNAFLASSSSDSVAGGNSTPTRSSSVVDLELHPFRPIDVELPTDVTGYCYVLSSLRHPDVSYIGETSRLGRRIDEHNSGSGSLQTASVHLRPWILLCFVAGFG